MAYDPTEPDTIEEIEDLEADVAPEVDVEAPEVDAAEQHADVTPDHDEPLTDVHPDRGNEADLIEQARVVSLDEDDYR
ncbi:hypothetical protein LK07_23225 [Streptomyces pluripotens]|uniref:DUF5709 domain-containing protein n=1 Tax=Streptomyces pluripotens TaxID=1355015 RepID=A0A221P2I2_9ACTN|nr:MULTISPECIES: hypothetical protein [Streptomyces]ARP72192.1 hypothetical protein LK06_022065 [Streptomyces pluripotens]ASN26441.1 hypothetical protein LK07_23225 [Streptomyces pluripotens]KIE27097.1 hypothetical protein LK08_09125 [Streptomyces sp. MUSC 125]MCH0556058.1 hypothetical protein [Streptomyces sp. MUM 16J]